MSEDATVADRVVAILTQRLGIPPEVVSPTAELAEELGVDSVVVTAGALGAADAPQGKPAGQGGAFQAVTPPEWVFGVTRMAFLAPGEVAKAAAAGAQVVHTNVVWPYFPLRRDGGGLGKEDARLRDLVADCRRHRLQMSCRQPPSRSRLDIRAHRHKSFHRLADLRFPRLH